MQVSWIEPDDLRALLGQLQQPAAPAKSTAVELHTLPNENGLGARELGIDEGDLWLPEDFAAPAAEVTPPPQAPSEALFSEALAALEQAAVASPVEVMQQIEEAIEKVEVQEESAAPPQPEQGEQLNRIREKLQAIRARALGAGLFSERTPDEAPTEPTPAAPVEEPAPAPSNVEPPPPPAAFEIEAPQPVPSPVSEPLFQPPVEQTPSLEDRLKPIESPFALDQPAVEPPPLAAIEQVFQSPIGAIGDRLDAFASWANSRFLLSNLIVVDDHGDILWGDHAQAGLVVSAMMACKAMMRSSALGASGLATVIEQPISTDRLLVIVPCVTSYGAVSIAFVRDRALTEEDVALLRAALVSAVETKPPPSSTPQTGSALD